MKFNLWKKTFRFALLWALLFGQLALGSDYQSPRTTALGGAGHAAPLLNDSLYMNPSYSSFMQTYSLAGNYNWYSGDPTNPDGSKYLHGHILNFSLLDGRSELFQAGAAYTQTEREKMIHLGASKQIIKQLGVGLGAKFNFPNDGSFTAFRDTIFSLSGVAADWFQASFIIDNIFETDSGVGRGYYREYIVGTKFNILKNLLIYIDPHWVPDYSVSFGHESGIEIPVWEDVFLRAGLFLNSWISYEAARGNGWAYGAGWIGPRISIDLGVSNANTPVNAVAINTGVTIYF